MDLFASAQTWLETETALGLAPNTISAYRIALSQFRDFVASSSSQGSEVGPADVAGFIRALRSGELTGKPAAPATIRLKVCAIRLYLDSLVLAKQINTNPIKRGDFRSRLRGPVPYTPSLPWIPSDSEWAALCQAAAQRSRRTRAMYSLAYDAALRRSELVFLQIDDIDYANLLLTVRPEHSKGRRRRTVPISLGAVNAIRAYLPTRKRLNGAAGRLFLSESPRNYGLPIATSSWTKEVELIARDANVQHFTTHSFRHLRCTDLARINWDIKRIAEFAGHRSLASTSIYIHLSARDLRDAFSTAASDFRLRFIDETHR